MIGDHELLAFRQGYYDLFVSLLWREPTGDLLARLPEGIERRIQGARHLHPALGDGWEAIGRFIAGADREALQEAVADEYTRLFLGPQVPEVHLYESFYLTGRLWDRPLAALRTFLQGIGIEKQEGYAEPEDFLAFELEVVRRLIAAQCSVGAPDDEVRWLNLQATFLKRHLLVWGPAGARDLGGAKGAVFYRGVAGLLQGFLELERDLFKGWGTEPLRSLEEARERYARAPDWKGPLLDPAGQPAPGPGNPGG
jgi:TorA maturation chaperone TorD